MEADLENARPERVFITHSGCDREYFQVTPAEEIAGVTSKLRCKLATPEDTKKGSDKRFLFSSERGT